MMCKNPNLDFVNQNLVKFLFVLKILSGKEIMTDGRTDRRNDRWTTQVQYSPLTHFQNGAIKIRHQTVHVCLSNEVLQVKEIITWGLGYHWIVLRDVTNPMSSYECHA